MMTLKDFELVENSWEIKETDFIMIFQSQTTEGAIPPTLQRNGIDYRVSSYIGTFSNFKKNWKDTKKLIRKNNEWMKFKKYEVFQCELTPDNYLDIFAFQTLKAMIKECLVFRHPIRPVYEITKDELNYIIDYFNSPDKKWTMLNNPKNN